MAFARGRPYDRARILAGAERARRRGRVARAVALYRRVLAQEPENADLHRKLAPLLAATGQRFDAWQSFRVAARDLMRQMVAEGEADALVPDRAWKETETALAMALGRVRPLDSASTNIGPIGNAPRGCCRP